MPIKLPTVTTPENKAAHSTRSDRTQAKPKGPTRDAPQAVEEASPPAPLDAFSTVGDGAPLSADAVLALTGSPKVNAATAVVVDAGAQKAAQVELRQYFVDVQREQWQFYADQVGPKTNFLPPDNVKVELGQPLVVDARTSPTNQSTMASSSAGAASRSRRR